MVNLRRHLVKHYSKVYSWFKVRDRDHYSVTIVHKNCTPTSIKVQGQGQKKNGDRSKHFMTPSELFIFWRNSIFTKRNILFLITKPSPKRNSKPTIGAETLNYTKDACMQTTTFGKLYYLIFLILSILFYNTKAKYIFFKFVLFSLYNQPQYRRFI